ncbi:hypothetical protein B0A53_04386, partial [Rhodotorula sp. CCFEE 5036]
MGPLADLFRRSDSSSPSKKQQHSTLDVPLPTSPFNLTVNNSPTEDAGANPPFERRLVRSAHDHVSSAVNNFASPAAGSSPSSTATAAVLFGSCQLGATLAVFQNLASASGAASTDISESGPTSAPALPGRVGQPVWSRAPDGRGAGLPPPDDVSSPMRSGFAYPNGSATSVPPPQTRPPQQGSLPYTFSSSKSSPAAQPRPLSPDENELPPPHTIAPRRASEPVRSSNSPASARSSPASSRRGAGQSRQCDGITALSKRCTRMVSLAAWAIPAGGVDLAGLDELAGEGAGGPVYCKQHAKLALVDSGCFVTVRSGDGASQERWISFSHWIDADLPIETQALLRHYMAKPVSRHDQEGYIYVHELVPRGDRGFSRSAPLNSTAHIKLGRTVKPVARLSQWRANCPSREPI